MPQYTITEAVTQYIEYIVEAESEEQARRIFEDAEDPKGNFDAMRLNDPVYEFYDIKTTAPHVYGGANILPLVEAVS